jgi:protein-tyrosine phosphatase
LAWLEGQDLETVSALGLRHVCDLRGVHEAAALPVEIPGANHIKLPIEPSMGASLKDILVTGQASGAVTKEMMLGLLSAAYRAYALQCHAQYRAVFALLLAEDGAPLLLHCSAGKDRTGFGAALILSALGVEWAHVVEDYLATNTLWRREIAGRLDLPADVKDVLLSAHEELLIAAFDAVRGAYGSVDAYLERAIGLDDAARARLLDRLTS